MKKKWGIVILAAVLTAVFLAAGSSGIKRVPYDGSRFVLTEQELREEIWLLQISGEHSTVPSDVWLFYLTISDDVPVCLYLLDSYKGALYINGEKAVQQDMLLGNIVMLPAGCTQYKIELRPAADHFLYMTRNYIYVGTQSHIWENMRQTQWRQGMFAGLFFFSALFALTLFMWKRSETYLIFYVVHALIVLVLSVRSELASAQFFVSGMVPRCVSAAAVRAGRGGDSAKRLYFAGSMPGCIGPLSTIRSAAFLISGIFRGSLRCWQQRRCCWGLR